MNTGVRLWLLLCLVALSAAGWAAGSWIGFAHSVRVAGPDHQYTSDPLVAPALMANSRITQLHWQYRLAPLRKLDAWLCAAAQCVPIAGRQGSSTALAGLAAKQTFRLKFRLPRGETRPVRVSDIELIVDYRFTSEVSPH